MSTNTPLLNSLDNGINDGIDDEIEDNYIEYSKINEPCYGSFMDYLGNFLGCCCIPLSCGMCCNPYKIVDRGHKGAITRFGSVKDVVDDGLHYVNPVSEKLILIDTMLHIKKLSNQSIITKNNLPITIDGCVYYRINNNNTDVINSKFGIYDLGFAVNELAHSTLRLVFGKHTLQECLEKRNEFAKEMRQILGNQARKWGAIIEDIQIIDIIIPKHIQDLLASSAIAQQEANAQILMTKASVASAKIMQDAHDILNTPAAMQIRMLETYKALAESENSKIIFLPADYGNMNNLAANLVGNQVNNQSNNK